jgi:DNA-binding MarR family transcriptional regulator
MTTALSTITELERELTLLARHHLHSSQHSDELALDRSAYQLLGRLEVEPMTLGQLAEAFRLDVSTVNRQIAALRRKKLVERVADPEGGVAHLLRPTRTGAARLRRDREVKRDQVSRVVEAWEPEDVARLGELLARFNMSIEGLEGRRWPRP